MSRRGRGRQPARIAAPRPDRDRAAARAISISSLILLLAASLAGPALARAHSKEPGCKVPDQIATDNDRWTRIAAPEFPPDVLAGGSAITSYAVDPYNPASIYASNGLAVMHSSDGGCIWKPVFVLSQAPSATAPFSSASSRIVSIVIPETPSGRYLSK